VRRIVVLVFVAGLVATVPLSDVRAQSAVGGAIIGGAIGGRRGAAIGAATGAVVGSHRRHWHNRYYWRHGRCWVRTSSGRSHQVSNRYCR
jgi:hypothetical protein